MFRFLSATGNHWNPARGSEPSAATGFHGFAQSNAGFRGSAPSTESSLACSIATIRLRIFTLDMPITRPSSISRRFRLLTDPYPAWGAAP